MIDYCDFLELFTNKKKIFFIGIGGISMSAVAVMAQKGGCRVAGYDATLSHITEKLDHMGIPVYDFFDESHFEDVSLIVYTGAVHAGDIELSYPRSLGIPEATRAEFLGFLMKKAENPIGVSGTHGKSTTTGMLSAILLADAGRDPSIMVGAEISFLGGTYRVGEGRDFLFEACEYQDSFLHFFPRIAVILNVEYDHADYFPSLDAVVDSFTRFADLAEKGTAVINADNAGAMRVAARTKSPLFFFSMNEKRDIWCENLSQKNGCYSFDVVIRGTLFTHLTLKIAGLHNVSNALAAAGAAYLSGVPAEAVKAGLESFTGVKRRFEFRGMCHGMRVYDDYAHHPDEISATLKMAHLSGFSPITVVFQSHTFSRTKAYFDHFVESLSDCDEVIYADIYPAREEPIPGIDAPALARRSPNGKYIGDFDAIAKYLLEKKSEGIIIIMGAGSVIQITDKILTDKE